MAKYLGFSRFNQLKFDKRLNSNKFRNKINSLDIIEENPSSYFHNISNYNNIPIENFSMRSRENSVESNKNKTQITFVCNSDIQADDRLLDLQYYLLQGNKNISPLNCIESPNRKNINLPLSTDKHFFTAGKSKISSSNASSIKNGKHVTPKFVINKDSQNNSASSKKKLINKLNSSNSQIKIYQNNLENKTLSPTGSMPNLISNSNRNHTLPFNAFLPVQSPKINNSNENISNLISKDDSIGLSSINLGSCNNINIINNNNIMNNSLTGSSTNNVNFVNSRSKNYFKEIVDSFKEKVLCFNSNNYENTNDSNNIKNMNYLNKNYNSSLNYCNLNWNQTRNFYNSEGKLNSTINYIDGNNNFMLNSYSGKLNFEKNYENLNNLKYRRNKNNSINYNTNNLLSSLVSSPAIKSKYKKSKSQSQSHSIHNFPVSNMENSDNRLNFEYNFPFTQKKLDKKSSEFSKEKLKYYDFSGNAKIENKNKSIRIDISNEVIKEEISSPTINTERNNSNPNRILVYSSATSESNNNTNGNNMDLVQSKSNNNLSSKIFKSNEYFNNPKNADFLNKNYYNNDFEKNFNNYHYKNISSSKEKDEYNNKNTPKSGYFIYKNNSSQNTCNNNNQAIHNKKNSKINEKSSDFINTKNNQNENFINNNNNSGLIKYKNNNFHELKNLNFQNNLLYLLNFLNNKIQNNKAYALNQLYSFTQNLIRLNKRYSVKILYRILKKRLIFLRLKFFTRSKFN